MPETGFMHFIEAIDSNEKWIKECQKNYRLLDEIILDKEKISYLQNYDRERNCFG